MLQTAQPTETHLKSIAPALEALLEIKGLVVEYPGGIKALRGVDLAIGRGLFGLLGPNGAGKTTLMRVLATLQSPSAGSAHVLGHDVVKAAVNVRRVLGYLPQDFQSYPQLRVWEALDYYAILNELTDVVGRRRLNDQLLEVVGLEEFRDRKVGQLSGGMLRRLGVAQALINNPALLILDEPTVGLDPAERIHFRNFLGQLSRDRVILLSTHIVSDIGSSCDRMAVLDRGRVLFQGRRHDLIGQAKGKVWRVLTTDAGYESLRSRHPVAGMVETPDGMELRVLAEQADAADWEPAAPNLEDAYLWQINTHTAHASGK
jgi:ABC-type multidrug transport system ATPase subunit